MINLIPVGADILDRWKIFGISMLRLLFRASKTDSKAETSGGEAGLSQLLYELLVVPFWFDVIVTDEVHPLLRCWRMGFCTNVYLVVCC